MSAIEIGGGGDHYVVEKFDAHQQADGRRGFRLIVFAPNVVSSDFDIEAIVHDALDPLGIDDPEVGTMLFSNHPGLFVQHEYSESEGLRLTLDLAVEFAPNDPCVRTISVVRSLTPADAEFIQLQILRSVNVAVDEAGGFTLAEPHAIPRVSASTSVKADRTISGGPTEEAKTQSNGLLIPPGGAIAVDDDLESYVPMMRCGSCGASAPGIARIAIGVEVGLGHNMRECFCGGMMTDAPGQYSVSRGMVAQLVAGLAPGQRLEILRALTGAIDIESGIAETEKRVQEVERRFGFKIPDSMRPRDLKDWGVLLHLITLLVGIFGGVFAYGAATSPAPAPITVNISTINIEAESTPELLNELQELLSDSEGTEPPGPEQKQQTEQPPSKTRGTSTADGPNRTED